MVKPIGAMPRASAYASSIWADRRWLVLAPHPDDEVIGTGALIIEAIARGTFAGLVFLTDGAASHPHSVSLSKARLASLRRREALSAVRILAGRHPLPPITFFDWPDAAPFEPGSPRFDTDARRLAALCRRYRVDVLAVTAHDEPHCDHEAAARLAKAAVTLARRPVALFDYGVWSSPPLHAGARCLSVDGRATWAQRQRALAAHRTQLTGVAGDGFRLTSTQADLRRRPFDLFFAKVFPHAQDAVDRG